MDSVAKDGNGTEETKPKSGGGGEEEKNEISMGATNEARPQTMDSVVNGGSRADEQKSKTGCEEKSKLLRQLIVNYEEVKYAMEKDTMQLIKDPNVQNPSGVKYSVVPALRFAGLIGRGSPVSVQYKLVDKTQPHRGWMQPEGELQAFLRDFKKHVLKKLELPNVSRDEDGCPVQETLTLFNRKVGHQNDDCYEFCKDIYARKLKDASARYYECLSQDPHRPLCVRSWLYPNVHGTAFNMNFKKIQDNPWYAFNTYTNLRLENVSGTMGAINIVKNSNSVKFWVNVESGEVVANTSRADRVSDKLFAEGMKALGRGTKRKAEDDNGPDARTDEHGKGQKDTSEDEEDNVATAGFKTAIGNVTVTDKSSELP